MPVPKSTPFLGEFARKLFVSLAGILLVYLIVLVGTVIRNNLAKFSTVGYQPKQERIITVDAEESLMVKPDIAIIRMGQSDVAPTVSEAQQKNTETLNALYTKLKALGIPSADVQTSEYRVSEAMSEEENGGMKSDGFLVSQTVTLRIRDFSLIEKVLALIGELDLNSVDGLQYVLDEQDAYQKKVRAMAIHKAKIKAKDLAQSLGVRLGKVVSYYEYPGSKMEQQAYSNSADFKSVGPAIEPGTEEVAVHVTMAFEIY